MVKKLTQDQFIQKAISVHGDVFSYEQTRYVNSKTKVTITCHKHGNFEQVPTNHLSGFGCIKCGFENTGQHLKKNNQVFIAQATSLHGDAYDYGKTDYVQANKKVTITCRLHGDFQQTPYSHLRSDPQSACLKCSYRKRANSAKITFDDFVLRARTAHGHRYDYHLSSKGYDSLASVIQITCKIHGAFAQSAAAHIAGKGCNPCSVARSAIALRKTTEQFILEARAVHGENYSYEESQYLGAFENLKIKCPIDGLFEQSPTSHLAGIGCPRCSRRAQGAPRNLKRALRGEFDDNKESFVYQIAFEHPQLAGNKVKIGCGTGSRISTVVTSIKKIGGVNILVETHQCRSTGAAIVLEFLAHQSVADSRTIIPTALKFPGYSEVFSERAEIEPLKAHPLFTSFCARHPEKRET